MALENVGEKQSYQNTLMEENPNKLGHMLRWNYLNENIINELLGDKRKNEEGRRRTSFIHDIDGRSSYEAIKGNLWNCVKQSLIFLDLSQDKR